MNEQQIETKIQEKGLNAPRLNPAAIDEQIVAEEYHPFESSKKTICQLTLVNGFTVIGEAGVVSPSTRRSAGMWRARTPGRRSGSWKGTASSSTCTKPA
jgi:hypothetical protein